MNEPVKGACEILGLDPLYVANEGKLVAIVAESTRAQCCELCAVIRAAVKPRSSVGWSANTPPWSCMKTTVEGTRIVDVMFGEQLPRIC